MAPIEHYKFWSVEWANKLLILWLVDKHIELFYLATKVALRAHEFYVVNGKKSYTIVKNPFVLSSYTLFQLHILYKSYRQILTPVINFRLLLKLEILDKLRNVTFHKRPHKESAMLELVHTNSREIQVLMSLTHKASEMKTLITKQVPFLWCH